MTLKELKYQFLAPKVQIITATSNLYMLESCNTLINLSNKRQESLSSIFPSLKKNTRLIERLANQQSFDFGTFINGDSHFKGTLKKVGNGFIIYIEKVEFKNPTNVANTNVNGKAAKELEKIKRLQKVKQDYFSKITHDIKLPLTEIVGTTYLLDQFVQNDKGKSYLGALNQAAKSLDTMLNDLVNFSKNESLNIIIKEKPFQLRPLIDAVVKTFEFKTAKINLPIVVNINDDVNDLLVGDATRLSQIIYNLLDNALKFTKKGKIEVCIENGQNDNVSFTISDTGIGIPKEKLCSIFDTYNQARKEDAQIGFGIGLSIVKQLVELLNGTINATSIIGKGSSFTFLLPFNKT